MPAINPLPTPPSRNDPANFSDRADAFLAALPAYTSEANALLDDVHASRDTVQGLRNEVIAAGLASAATNAATATTKAAEASASAAEAFGYLQAYRATSYGALASDPVVDPIGNPPTVGDEYFNTTMNLLKRFNGVTWQASDIATADLAAPGGSTLVGVQQDGTDSVPLTVEDEILAEVDVMQFGAVCNGVDDDSAAVQKAVNYCLSMDPPAVLTVPGVCALHNPVNIDRPIDAANTATFFTIRGKGKGACFYAPFGVTMLTTTLTSADPGQISASQKVHFDGLVFKSFAPSNPTYVLDDAKFLRVKFTNCAFHRIKLTSATRFLQTYYFSNCMAYGWQGAFIGGTGGAYDIKIDGFIAEAGTSFYSVVCDDVYSGDPNAQVTITNSLFQSMGSFAIQADRAQGFVVQNCYFEGNGQDGSPDIKFDTARNLANQTPNTSVTVSGCYFSQLLANFNNPAYFSVRWGRTTKSGFAAGNHLVNLGTGAALKLHYTIPESRVTFMGEPGYVQGYFSQMVYSGGGYVMPGDGGERLRLVRGTVEASGVVSAGGGFTVTKIGAGQYQFEMLTAFDGLPSVVASAGGTTGQNLASEIGINSPSQFVINFKKVDHTYADTKFFFTAIGQAL